LNKADILQWSGAVAIIAGHVFNAIGPAVYPWNIVAFTAGTVCFGAWTMLVRNKPQFVVNAVAMLTCVMGLAKAWG
jgi:hypothetical protein